MGVPVNVKLEPEDRARLDEAIKVADRFVKVLERLSNLLKEEKK